MKVGLLYIIAFDGSGDEETKAAIDGLVAKYKSRGLSSKNIVTVFINQETVYYQLLKNTGRLDPRKLKNALPSAGKLGIYKMGEGSEAFTSIEKDGEIASMGGGVGVYFLFHGTAGDADISNNVTISIIESLMAKHPNGALRKVVFVVCAFASAMAGKGKTSELLGKFATSLQGKHNNSPDLPKMAGYTSGVYVGGSGAKFSDASLSTKISDGDTKVFYMLDPTFKYQKKLVQGDAADWSDPVVVTNSNGGSTLSKLDVI